MRVSSLFPALAGLLLVAGPPTAVGASGVAEFLRLGLGARAFALGGGLLSVGHDPSALCWNPALMARTPSAAAEIMHSENFSGAAGFDALAWTGPIGRGSGEALGVGILRLSVDDIPVTDRFAFDDFGSDARPGTHDPGEGDGRWQPGEPVQVDPSRVEWRSDAEWALLVGYARAFGPRVSAGVCAKYLRQEVAGRRGEGFGLDVGLRAEVLGAEVAARVSDITTTRVAWDSGRARACPRPWNSRWRASCAWARAWRCAGCLVRRPPRTSRAGRCARGAAAWSFATATGCSCGPVPRKAGPRSAPAWAWAHFAWTTRWPPFTTSAARTACRPWRAGRGAP